MTTMRSIIYRTFAFLLAFSIAITSVTKSANALGADSVIGQFSQVRTIVVHTTNVKNTSSFENLSIFYNKTFQPLLLPSTILRDFAIECEKKWNPILNFVGGCLFVIDGVLNLAHHLASS
ncbi:hypothetical protein Cal7507_3874 [Calothrix sp. PCC 7507]|nr:hypothetical protein Cal7507_3874 [Calothrix sp. PCC 7507]